MGEIKNRIRGIGKSLTLACSPLAYYLQPKYYEQLAEQEYNDAVQSVINAYFPPITARDFENLFQETEQDMINSILRKKDIKLGN